MSYGLGYIADPENHRRLPFGHLATRLPLALTSSTSLADALPPVMDQGATGSCVGHAFAAAIAAAMTLADTPLPWVPSPAGIYTLARAIDRVPYTDGSLPALRDEGSQPNQAARSVNLWGVHGMVPVAGRFSDADPAHINDEPQLMDIELDAASLLVGDYGIYADVASSVRTAIGASIPVCAAVPGGSSAWQNYAGGVLGPQAHSNDHYVCLYAYELQSDGSYVYRIRNSWSSGWGLSGDCVVSEAALSWFSDVIAVSVRRA